MSANFLKINLETVKDIKIEQGVKINTFFEEFLVKDNKAYKLEKIMLPVTPFSMKKLIKAMILVTLSEAS